MSSNEFLDQVTAECANRGQWFDRLPDEAKESLEAARQRFKTGEFTVKDYQVAASIIAAAMRRGWPMPQQKAVVTWLRN